MRNNGFKALLIAAAFSMNVHAALISLKNDFSISNGNPNGQWAYLDNTSNLTLQVPQNNGNALYPAVSNGYWGKGNNLNADTPDLFKAQVNGSSAGETNLDFVAGDIVGHSPNDGSTLFESWTAPSDGTISQLQMRVWYAHSAVTRGNSFMLLDNSTVLSAGSTSPTSNYDRNNPASYANNAGFSVAAGDVISLGITKLPAQASGSLTGESLDFTFTANAAVPEPATIGLMGLALMAFMFYTQRRKIVN